MKLIRSHTKINHQTNMNVRRETGQEEETSRAGRCHERVMVTR